MKDYKNIQELDMDLITCRIEINAILRKYGFNAMYKAQILIEEGECYLRYLNQPYRDEIIENERLTNK